MKIKFRTNKLEKSLKNDKELFKRYGVLAKKIRQRMQELAGAENLLIISQLPVLRLHPHLGQNKNIWSIDIQQNWRILFTIANDPIPILDDGGINIKEVTIICIESIEDPH